MKKFIMITPLQGYDKDGQDALKPTLYKAPGNSRLEYKNETRFPLILLINGYAEEGEEIRVFAITPETEHTPRHVKQLSEELSALQEKKGFKCKGVEVIPVLYAGDVRNQIDIFHKVINKLEDNDRLYGCITFGNKPMPIAEIMAIEYAYRVLENVTIGCLIYGEKNHTTNEAIIFDITAMIQLNEITSILAEKRVKDPKRIMDLIIDGE